MIRRLLPPLLASLILAQPAILNATPGTGQVNWTTAFNTLREVGYDGWLVIEAFGRALPDLAAASATAPVGR